MVTIRSKVVSIRGFITGFFTILACLSLMVTLLSAGFAACTLKPASYALSFAFSNSEQSPYLKSDLVSLAMATQDYTLNDSQRSTLGTEAARENICSLTVESAWRATDVDSSVRSRWSEAAIDVVENSTGKPSTTVNEELAAISMRYALDESAFDHLDDCYRVISAIKPVLIGAFFACIISLCLLVAFKRLAAAAKVLLVAPCALIALLIACGVWACMDFASFFECFHRILFFQSTQGSWIFPYDSLLIIMLPTPFWAGMAIIWAVVSILCCIACIILGKKGLRLARKGKAKA